MQRNNNRNRRATVRVSKQDRNAQVVHLLTDLVELNKTQVNGTVPRVKDPERLYISPRRLVTMERTVQLGGITLSTAPLDTFGAYALRLSDFPSFSEWVTTFDDYRIIQMEYVFTPTAENNFAGSLVTVVDYDTSSAPVAINDLLQYKSCQITESGTTCIRRLTPRVADAVYSGAFTSYGLQTSPWISTDSSTVFHYGLRWGIAGITGQPANSVQYNVWCRAVFQFRNTR